MPRYRLNFSVSINNLTNRANYGGFNGNLSSADFGKPLSASGVRSVRFNAGLSF
jgi:tRNA G26 N,N-dimethylase Trm1